MIDKSVITVGLVTFAVALLAPHLKAPDGAANSGTFSERSEPHRAEVARPTIATPTSSSMAELRRDGDSHFRASALVNGRPLTMLVDSGASLVVLTEGDARAVGIYLSPSDFTAVAQTADGEVKTAPVMIERISVNGIERRNVPGAVVPAGLLTQSLLGQSYLGQLAEVSIRDDVMRLR
jgi:aspartyl protease family protein